MTPKNQMIPVELPPILNLWGGLCACVCKNVARSIRAIPLAFVFYCSGAAALSLSVTSLNDNGPGTLRQAVVSAGSGDAITFAVAGTVILTSGEIQINKSLNISAPAGLSVVISGNYASRVFNILSGVMSLNGLVIANGQPPEDKGGGILNQGTLNATNCGFFFNRAYAITNKGGAIFNGGSLVLDHCAIATNYVEGQHNWADASGAGVYNDTGASAIINGCGFTNNVVGFGAVGGVWSAGMLTINASTFWNNGPEAVFSVGTTAITNSTFARNSGGGVSIAGQSGCLVSSRVCENSGGGLANGVSGPGGLLVDRCTISGNTNYGTGGGILNQGSLCLLNSTVASNFALGGALGGGCANSGSGIKITNCTFAGNFASCGGAIYHASSATGILACSTLSANSADRGGAIYSSGTGKLYVIGSTIALNTANLGGGIYSMTILRVFIRSSILALNRVAGTGAAGPDYSGQIISQDFNLIQQTNANAVLGAHDIAGQDPRLGSLQNNGGPTSTHALLAGSPAIDAGNSSGLATDQRGHARLTDIPSLANANIGDGTDIGAFELDNLITGIEKAGPDIRVSFIGSSNQTYRLQYATAAFPPAWIDLPGSYTGNGGVLTVTDPGASSFSNRFYRVRQDY